MSVWDFLSQFIRPGITEGGLIVIAILVTISILAIFVFPKVWAVIKQNAEDTREIKSQVKNSHSTNLREEQDVRHDELATGLAGVQGGIAALLKAVQGIQDDVRTNRERIDYVGDRLTSHIEKEHV